MRAAREQVETATTRPEGSDQQRTHLPPCVAQVAGSDDDDDEVRAEEREDDEHVAPAMVEADVQRCVEIVANRVLAVLAVVRVARVIEVSARDVHEVTRPVAASLTRRRREDRKLVGLAPDLETVELSAQRRGEDTREGVELVDPRAPEVDHGRVRDRDTAERREDDHDRRVEENGDLHAGCDGADGLSEGDTEELDEDDEQELEARAVQTRRAVAKVLRVDLRYGISITTFETFNQAGHTRRTQ